LLIILSAFRHATAALRCCRCRRAIFDVFAMPLPLPLYAIVCISGSVCRRHVDVVMLPANAHSMATSAAADTPPLR